MLRFLPAILAGLPLLAACTAGVPAAAPGAPPPDGFGDPVRGAALSAPLMLGDTARYAGRPAQAALAAVQLEIVAEAFLHDPRYLHAVSGTAQHTVRLARTELREAIGIAPDAPADPVIAQLRQAASALDAGQTAQAEAALSGPNFPAGPRATLAHLGQLPHLDRVSEAAGAISNEMWRLDSPRPDDD
jgi:hypothetical protein